MNASIRIPIRVKILFAVLFVVSAVVSIITFTMAHLFHLDKKAYVSDLASVIAVHAADEASVILRGYRGRLTAVSGLLDDPRLDADRRNAVFQELFASNSGFVGVEVLENGQPAGSAYDERTLQGTGVTAEQLRKN